jgi:serine/threonine protein kinase
MEPDELPPGFWTDLEGIIDGLHQRGIAHADLKTLENILVDEAGCVHIVDFNSAVLNRGPLLGFAFRHVSADDRRAIVKAKLELCPELVTDAERRFLEERSLAERAFRRLRRPIRRFAKWLGGKPDQPGPGRPSVQRRKRQQATSQNDPPA